MLICLVPLGCGNGSLVREDVCWVSEVGICEEELKKTQEVELQSSVVGRVPKRNAHQEDVGKLARGMRSRKATK
jgi:hypothetical protein